MIDLWLITGIIVFLSIAVFNTLQKKLVGNNSPIDVAYFTNIIAAVVLAPLAIYYSLNAGITIQVIGFLVLTGIFNALSFYLWPLALSEEDLGVIAPTRGITPITIAVIEPFVFFNLDYSIELLGASVLAGVGLYIAFSEEGLLTPIKKLQSKGALFGLGSAVAISGAVLVDRFAVHSAGAAPQVYAFGIASVTAVLLAGFRMYRTDQTDLIPERKYIPVGVVRGIIIGAGVFTLTLTTGTEYNVLIQLAIPLSVLLGFLFLDERAFTIRQLIGSLIIIGGVYLIL